MKIRLKLVLIIIALLATPAFAQNLDSTEAVLRNTTGDSTRFALMIDLSKKYQYKNFASAKQFSEQALALAENKNWPWAKVTAYTQVGF